MSDDVMLKLVPVMFAAVIAVIGWIGKRLHDKMDDVSDQLSDHRLETERRITRLESDMNGIGERLKHIETVLER